MNKSITFLLLLVVGSTSAIAQVGINSPIPQATLDITAKTADGTKPEGVLAPRLTGNQIQTADPQYGTAQKGMIIYATSSVTAPTPKTINMDAEGYYYFDGNKWLKMGTGAYSGSNSVTLNSNAFQRAALTGDATAAANSNATTVVGLQGRPLATTTPVAGDLMSYNGTNWTPLASSASNIPKQVLSVGVPGNQNLLGSYPSGIIVAFYNEHFDPQNAWNGTVFTVPAGQGGTYTFNMQTAQGHTGSTTLTSWWVKYILERIDNNGVIQILTLDINSGLEHSDYDNGNVLIWSGNLLAGDRLRVKAIYSGDTSNNIDYGNISITKL